MRLPISCFFVTTSTAFHAGVLPDARIKHAHRRQLTRVMFSNFKNIWRGCASVAFEIQTDVPSVRGRQRLLPLVWWNGLVRANL